MLNGMMIVTQTEANHKQLATLLKNFERARLDYGFFPTRHKVEVYEDLPPLRRRRCWRPAASAAAARSRPPSRSAPRACGAARSG